MEAYLAHIADDGREQSVEEHLKGTAERCAQFSAAFGAAEQGKLLGLLHDIGKYSDEFQKRLHGGTRVDHATAGALEILKMTHADWGAFCIAGHHSGLPDGGNAKTDQVGDTTLFGRLKGMNCLPDYKKNWKYTPFPVNTLPHWGESRLSDSFLSGCFIPLS